MNTVKEIWEDLERRRLQREAKLFSLFGIPSPMYNLYDCVNERMPIYSDEFLGLRSNYIENCMDSIYGESDSVNNFYG